MIKLWALNIGTAAAIGFLWFTGFGTTWLTGATLYTVSALLGLTALGVLLYLMGSSRWSMWISNHMTRFGMAGTAVGLVMGMTTLQFTSTDTAAVATELASHVGFAFLSTLFGILGNIWLNFNFELGGGNEQA